MSGLRDEFTDELTDSQLEAVTRLEAFLADENTQCFILKGYAGTGKTFLIRGLARYLDKQHKNAALMAPTGRAAMVLARRTSCPAYTIHKSIYILDRMVEIKDEEDEFKTFFSLREEANEETSVIYIVDEASMVSDIYSDSEFCQFGSGRLLADLIRYTRIGIGHLNPKIIFVGDPAQLPPVNSAYSPALNARYLQREHGLKTDEHVLSDVVRQEQESTILQNATRIRTSIEQNLFNRFEISCGPDTEIIRERDIEERYFHSTEIPPVEDRIVIAWRNRTVLSLNKILRTRMFGGSGEQPPQVGDRLIIVYNNATYGLFNGDFAEVAKVAPAEEIREVVRKQSRVQLSYRDVTLECLGQDGKPYLMDCKILENVLLSGERDISRDEHIALYIDFKARNADLRPNTEQFSEALRSDPYFNALRVKYGYAITCNKAQGGEWPTAFVLFEDRHWTNQDAFRWAYTAITRAKQTLLAAAPPSFRPVPPPVTPVAGHRGTPASPVPPAAKGESAAEPFVVPFQTPLMLLPKGRSLTSSMSMGWSSPAVSRSL
ncbi:ATP-dependent RecD-like DNA helicase [Gemmatimonadota bacterium]